MATDFNKNALSSAGGFKPSSVDTPIDVRARVETEADILTIPKPYIGMVIYVKDSGKRFEVLSLKDGKIGVLTVKNGLVNEYRELLVSYNELLDKPEIPSVEGLASEEFVQEQIAAIEHPTFDDSHLATKEELTNKVDVVEGKSLVDNTEIEKLSGIEEGANNYVLPVASVDSLGGVKAGSNVQITQDGVINGANYQFQVNMIENGLQPSVEMQGEFPNITVVFNIPLCLPTEVVPAGKMWYGRIPCDEGGITGWNNPEQVMEGCNMQVIKFGLDAGSLVEADPEAKGKIVLNAREGDWICVILPKDSNLVAAIDNGMGQQVTFEAMDAGSTGIFADGLEITNPISNIYYRMYGLPDSNGGGIYTVYINEK